MRKNFGPKPWLFPMPVMMVASYDEEERPDVMPAVWGGLIGEDRLALCVSPVHKTARNILQARAFTVSPADAAHLEACDLAGLDSANDVPDKFDRTGFTQAPSAFVHAPVICELPLALECELISYDAESGQLLGRIVNVSAPQELLDPSGDIDPERFQPLLYDPIRMAYQTAGPLAGRAFYAGLPLRD